MNKKEKMKYIAAFTYGDGSLILLTGNLAKNKGFISLGRIRVINS